MSETTSIGTMIKRISGLAGTSDVTPWETGFINSIVADTLDGVRTGILTEKQIGIVSRIHARHFESAP